MTDIKFDRSGDIVYCEFEGGVYKQVGNLRKFIFTKKISSRRNIRTTVKQLLKLSED